MMPASALKETCKKWLIWLYTNTSWVCRATLGFDYRLGWFGVGLGMGRTTFGSSSIWVVFHLGRLSFGLSSIWVVLHLVPLPFWSSYILVIFHLCVIHLGRLPFESDSILVVFHLGPLPFVSSSRALFFLWLPADIRWHCQSSIFLHVCFSASQVTVTESFEMNGGFQTTTWSEPTKPQHCWGIGLVNIIL